MFFFARGAFNVPLLWCIQFNVLIEVVAAGFGTLLKRHRGHFSVTGVFLHSRHRGAKRCLSRTQQLQTLTQKKNIE